MDFKLNERKLPPPNNIIVSIPKGPRHLLVIWDVKINPDRKYIESISYEQDSLNPLIKKVKYNVYRGISLNGIFYKMNMDPLVTPRFEDKNIGKNL